MKNLAELEEQHLREHPQPTQGWWGKNWLAVVGFCGGVAIPVLATLLRSVLR
jgi:hypothetical protein